MASIPRVDFDEDDFIEKPVVINKADVRPAHSNVRKEARDGRRTHAVGSGRSSDTLRRRTRTRSPRLHDRLNQRSHREHRSHKCGTHPSSQDGQAREVLRENKGYMKHQDPKDEQEDEEEEEEEEVGPQLLSTARDRSTPIDVRAEYEEIREEQHRNRFAARDRDRSERKRQKKLETEVIGKPDIGHDRRIVKSANNRDILRDFQDPDQSVTMPDSAIFAEDEIKARMKRDEERRQERAKVKQMKELERDHVRLERMEKLKAKEATNMALLQALAKKRYG